MKTWKTISITALTTLGLIAGGSFVYTSNQPANYEGKTFNLTARNSPTSKVAGCKGFGLVQGLAPCA